MRSFPAQQGPHPPVLPGGGDAAFAPPEVYEYLEAEGYLYAIRLPANEVLQREIEPFLTRPVGRPSNKPVVCYHDFLYRASTWDKPRRLFAAILERTHQLRPRAPGPITD